MTAHDALTALALAWMRAHRNEIPTELPPPGKLEPIGRGHCGHTHACMLDAARLPGGDDPLDVVLAREALAQRLSGASVHDRLCLRDALAAARAPARRAPGWTGRVGAARTLERRRAEARAADEAGQMGLAEVAV